MNTPEEAKLVAEVDAAFRPLITKEFIGLQANQNTLYAMQGYVDGIRSDFKRRGVDYPNITVRLDYRGDVHLDIARPEDL